MFALIGGILLVLGYGVAMHHWNLNVWVFGAILTVIFHLLMPANFFSRLEQIAADVQCGNIGLAVWTGGTAILLPGVITAWIAYGIVGLFW